MVEATKNAGKAESAETPSSMKGSTEPAVTTSMSEASKNSDDNEAADPEDQGRINPELQAEYVLEDVEEVEETGPNQLQLYNPSSMLSWGQFDAKFFQQLYTQTASFDADGNTIESNSRANYYSGIGNFVLGYNNRLNFGMDFWVQSVFIDTAKGSPLRTFSSNRGDFGRTALTALGPKVKWQPFASVNNFTVQSSFLLPVANNPEGDSIIPYLATENFLWWTQIFYTNNISDKFQFFAEVDLYWNIDRSFDFERSGFLAAPMSVFLSYFPTSKVTLYVNNQFWPNLGGENLVSSWWYQAGIGGKYQLTSSVDLEVSAGKFLAGRDTAGPASTFNLGIRYVKF